MSWRTLAIAAGAGMAVLLMAAAAGFRDIEAAAIALATLVALSLLRVRTGFFGLLLLGLLAADVGAWMIPGAISNLAHRGSWVATALPSALSIAALTAIVGVIGSMIERRSPATGSRAPSVAALAACVLLVGSGVAGAAGSSGATSPMREGDLSVITRNMRFTERELTADAGRVGVVVENSDLFWHTFTIRKLDVNLRVPVQAERRTSFKAEPGTYEFVCAIPGHEQAGMNGTLKVR